MTDPGAGRDFEDAPAHPHLRRSGAVEEEEEVVCRYRVSVIERNEKKNGQKNRGEKETNVLYRLMHIAISLSSDIAKRK